MKIKILLPIILVMIFLVSFAVDGAVSFTNPASGDTLTGTAVVNVRATLTSLMNSTNATLYLRNQTSEAWILVQVNTTANATYNSSVFQFFPSNYTDSSTAQLNITFFNNTNGIDVALLSINIDNNAPTITSYNPNKVFTRRSSPISLSCSASDVVDAGLVYTHVLVYPDSGTVNISRTANAEITWEGNELLTLSTTTGYDSYCYVTDNANLNSSTKTNFLVYGETDSVQQVEQKREIITQEKAKSNNTFLIVILGGGVVAILIIVFAVITLSKTSKKRRR